MEVVRGPENDDENYGQQSRLMYWGKMMQQIFERDDKCRRKFCV